MVVEEICTITAKGQTTIPKTVRQALGVGYGARIAFRIENGTVTVHPADDEATDPALAPFLDLLARDIANRPEALAPLTEALIARAERLTAGVIVDLDAPIEATSCCSIVLLRHGWTLFAHPLFLDQFEKLLAAAARARRADPDGSPGNANVRLLATVLALMLDRVPRDPLSAEYRQGNTLGAQNRHWFRVKFGANRFRLFFRADSASRIIVYAWFNDRDTLRKAGASTDPYVVFSGTLTRGNPPGDWSALLAAASAPEAMRRLDSIATEPAP